jgi:hypothetical protein
VLPAYCGGGFMFVLLAPGSSGLRETTGCIYYRSDPGSAEDQDMIGKARAIR